MFKQIAPQLCRGVFRESQWADAQWIAEEKYDGDRRIAQFCGDLVRFTGRRKSVKGNLYVEKTANVPHLSGFGKSEFSRPPPLALNGTVLDGEMMINPANIPGIQVDEGRSKYVTSIMGSLPEEAIRKQRFQGFLKYVVFDLLAYKGVEFRHQPWGARRVHLEQAWREWGNPHVFLAEYSLNKRGLYQEVMARGGEGVVLKNVNALYGDQHLWVKVKKEFTEDVVIMGYITAKEMSKKVNGEVSMTKYAAANLIGAIQVGQYGKDGKLYEVATVSGMTDEVRADVTKDGRYYLGRVVEIVHNGREPTGRFRHPRFRRFRDDKESKECRLANS